MIHKLPFNVLNKVWGFVKIPARYSALFINGQRATETYVYITPYINFNEQMQQKDVLKEHLHRRKLNTDLDNVENLWIVYEELKQYKTDLVKKKKELSSKIDKLLKDNPNSQEIDKYQIQIKLIKEDIKKLKVPLWSAEETAFHKVLELPNTLHLLTPDSENTVLYVHPSPQPSCDKNHLKIGQELNLLKFKKNEHYYLLTEAALFEIGSKFYFNSILKKNNFVQFSNPDFVKSVIVEGCGKNHRDPNSTFILHHNDENSKANIDNRLHLTGGGSLCSFFAYHAKNVLRPNIFPLKYFSMSQQYLPAPKEEDSLFNVSQSAVVEIFGLTKTSTECDKMLHNMIDLLVHAYSKIGYHFRLSILSADKLCLWESLRIIVEMYSTSLKSYIEVANISVSGDYISKRLLLSFIEDKQTMYPHVISGTILNVPKFLGCALEQDGNFSVPELFRINNWCPRY